GGRRPRPAQGRGHRGRGHPVRPPVDNRERGRHGGRKPPPQRRQTRRCVSVPGNSQRRGRRTTSKKGTSAGSGGKNRARLAGRGRTLPAEERPWHKGYTGEDVPAGTARKQERERRAAAATGRTPKVGTRGATLKAARGA